MEESRKLFTPELGAAFGNGFRIFAVEAGRAVVAAAAWNHGEQSLDAEVLQRVGSEEFAGFVFRHAGCDEFG